MFKSYYIYQSNCGGYAIAARHNAANMDPNRKSLPWSVISASYPTEKAARDALDTAIAAGVPGHGTGR